MSPVERWLEERLAGVPAVLRAWVRRSEGPPDDVVGALVTRGRGALAEAVARPGRDRVAAYHLLAADAYLTWACEAAAEADDPGEVLVTLLRAVEPDSG